MKETLAVRKGRKVLPLVLAALFARGANAIEPPSGAPDANGDRQGRPAVPASGPSLAATVRAAAVVERRVTPGSAFSPVAVMGGAAMVYPTPGDPDVNFWQAFAWTEVQGAVSYQLQVGSATGLSDVYDSGETPRTSLTLPLLAAGTYQGRIATNVGGRWSHRDFTFGSSGYPAAALRSPSSGSVVGSGQAGFSWDAVPNAAAYRLQIGTTFGEANVADSGIITTNSFELPYLPQGAILYARLLTMKWGAWRSTDAILSTGPALLPTLVAPADGAPAVNTGVPFEWAASRFATSYRLTIGTSPAGDDLHDSGEVAVVKRFVGSLPLGRKLYGRIAARIGTVWAPLDFSFTVGANGDPGTNVVHAALWATDFVRGMANDRNVPYSDTPLASLLAAEGYSSAFCTDYAAVLISMLRQMNVTLPARPVNACLKPNQYDCHTLVEFQEPLQGTWMLLDPTFDLTVRRSADGQWATAQDVSQATRAMSFSDVTYQFLGARGNSVAKSYYLDYPLLYLVVYRSEGPPATYPSSMRYMDPVSMPVRGEGLYAVQGTPGDGVDVMVDGVETHLSCDQVDGLTYIFWAGSVDSLSDPVQAFHPHRFVF